MPTGIDLLAFGAHPDDVELSCSGTLISHIEAGGTAGIVDLTKGELGTRGTIVTREKEAEDAARLMGVSFRLNLELADGFFRSDEESLLKVVRVLRRYRPKVVLANAIKDRHPDHGRGASLVTEACFLAGLRKVETEYEGKMQEVWRPQVVYHYVQDYYVAPQLVVDISHVFEKKMAAIQAFSSQFYTGKDDKEPATPISSKGFMEFIRARAIEWGRPIGAQYGEAYTIERVIGTKNLLTLT